MQVSGSDINDGLGNDLDLLTLDITGTASTASYVAGANVDGTVATATSASHAIIADSALSALTATSASHALNADNAISSSYAVTASFALNAGASTLQEVLDNSNTATGVDIILTGSYQRASGSFSGNVIDNITDTYTGTEKINHVITLTQAEYNALTPAANTFYVITDADATMVTGSVSNATLTFTKDDASTFDLTVDNVANAVSASHAIFADTASFLPSDTNLNINSITASFASFSSASIGYLQAITGSAKIIGDAFIILNNNTPTERFAGIVVQDSGSTNNTASLEFDGQTNDWFYEYTDDGGATTDHGVAMFGPEYNTKGSPVYNTANTLVKGDGGHHLLDSSISDDGTLVTIDANVSASGYVSASSFIGDGSQLTGISTDPFPYTGSAEITGSLGVTGSVEITGSAEMINCDPSTSPAGGKALFVAGTIDPTGVNLTSAKNSVALGASRPTINAGAFQAAIIAADVSTVGGTRNGVFGGYDNDIGNVNNAYIYGGAFNDITGNGNGLIIVGSNTGLISGGSYSTIVGGLNQTISNGNHNAILAGSGNTATHDRSAVIGGSSLSTSKADEVVVPSLSVYGEIEQGDTNSNLGTNTAILSSGHSLISASVVDSSIISSTGSFISQASNYNNVILASEDSSNVSTGAVYNSAIIASENTSFSGTGTYWNVANIATRNSFNNNSRFSAIIGGETNKLQGFYSNVIAGGSNNEMKQATNSTIAGGTANRIGTSTQTDRSFIGGGSGHLIQGGDDGAILGGLNADITSGHDRVVILGGNGLQSSKSDEVVVPSLTTNGAVVQNVEALSIVTNVAELDASLGNMFTLTLQNGVDTELQLINQSAGQTFSVQITNNATAAGTISFDSQFEFEGGTAFTATAATSAVDILTFTCFGGGNVQCVSAKNFS